MSTTSPLAGSNDFQVSHRVEHCALLSELAGIFKNIGDIVKVAAQAIGSFATCITAPLYIGQGFIMAGLGVKLIGGAGDRFKKALGTSSDVEKYLSGSNLLNKVLLIKTGLVQIGIGIAGILLVAIPATAGLLAASTILGILFAAIVTIRGLEMTMRGGYTLWKIHQVQKEFFAKQNDPVDLFHWAHEKLKKDPEALKTLIGEEALGVITTLMQSENVVLQELMKDAATLTQIQPISSFIATSNPEQLEEAVKKLAEFTSELDKGIAREKMNQKLVLSIGAAMFLGGLLALIVIVMSHGTATPILGLSCAVAGSSLSLLMEGCWVPYDWKKARDRLFNWVYKKHQAEHPVPNEDAIRKQLMPSQITNNAEATSLQAQERQKEATKIVDSFQKEAAKLVKHWEKSCLH